MALDPDSLFRIHSAYRSWETGRFQSTGTVNDHWLDLMERDPLLQSVTVCVELVIGRDTVVRVAHRPVSTTSSSTGRVYRYQPILQEQPDLQDTYTMGQSASQGRSMTIRIPNRYVDVAKLIGQGRLLAGVAEVSLQVDGGDYDQRLVWLRGDMADGLTFAAVRELVEFTITDPRDTVDVSLPPFVIDGTSWPVAGGAVGPAENAQGQRYALVPTTYLGVPCWWVDPAQYTGATPSAVVCIGHLDDTGYVVIDGEQYSTIHPMYGYSWEHTQDARGVSVTTVRFTGSARGTFTFSEQVYAYPKGGDAVSDHPLDAVRMTIERFTAMGTSGVSDLLFSTARAKPPGREARLLVNAGGAGNTPTLAYLEGEFLASFPMISMLWHGTGYGPVVTDRRSPVVAYNLRAGQWPVLDRASSVTETPKADCYNDFTLQFAYDPVEDTYAKIATRGAYTSNLCGLSLDQIGNRPMDVIESPYIFDETTAGYVLDWMVDHMTFPSYVVQYAVASQLFVTLKPGDNVRITDSDFGWDKIVATVEGLEWLGSHAVITLRVWWRYYTLGTGAATGDGNGPPTNGQGQGGGGNNQGGGG